MSLYEFNNEWVGKYIHPNILDITNLINMILNNSYHETADLNEDGGLNILDVIILVNLILGL